MMMLAAFLLVAAPVDWAPARWYSGDPKSLELIARTPINCLLLERANWSGPFVALAAERGIATLGVVRPGPDAVDQARKAAALHMSGVVLEGDFDAKVREALADSKILTIELPSRAKM